jgi:uncharacterized membrane protein SpoIIM required for sporulation
MAELQLKSHRFRAEREADWRRLERLMEKAQRRGPRRLEPSELIEMPVLYRQALSSLSVARAISLDQALIDYLEGLCARAYFFVYGTRSRGVERLTRFFAHDWPAAVQGIWRETLAAALITLLAAVVTYGLVAREPDWYYAFVPRTLAAGRDPAATTQSLAATLHGPLNRHEGLDVLAAFLFTHNAQIALFAFAFGFALCVMTIGLMAVNGCTVGAFLALFASHGLLLPAGGWLLIHGVTELFAVILAGGAGLSIGWAVVFPGERTRLDAAVRAGRRGGLVMAGVVVMLFVAALLEGFARQLIQLDAERYAIAAASAFVWGSYFYAPLRSRTRSS